MSSPPQTFAELLARDPRFRPEAYQFVYEALTYAHDVLGMGGRAAAGEAGVAVGESGGEKAESDVERHLSGQQLCEAARRLAIDQFGLMAKCVLNSWGVHRTADFGEIVYNLISINKMRKTADDRREDFDDVFDFDTGLRGEFRFSLPE